MTRDISEAAEPPVSEPPYVAATLKWCNEKRAEKGKKPLKKLPKGWPEDPHSCPCGKATGLYVDWATFRASASLDNPKLPLPGEVQAFVAAFDEGELPQYEASRR